MLKKITESLPQLIFMCRAGGDNFYFNQRWVHYTGLSLEESCGTGWTAAFHPDDNQSGTEAKEKTSGYEVKARIRGHDGTYRWFLIRGDLISHESDPEEIWLGTCTDIDDLQRAQEELRSMQDELESRVRERTEALNQATIEAQRANAAKSEFLSRTSHELRTPLNAILGFGQLLEMSDLSEQDHEGATLIVKSGRYLLTLINEVLDIASVESGNLPMSVEPVSLAETIAYCCSMIEPLAEQRNISLSFDLRQIDQLHVMADRQRLKQVLLNLLSNGVKYNRIGGNLRVNCVVQQGESVQIQVSDTGLGIAETDIAKLFSPFERLDAGNSEIEGSGLGLALARNLTQAMNGTLHVTSCVGEGSCFTVTLPLALGSAIGMYFSEDFDGQVTQKDENFVKHNLLYIEDNPSNIHLMEAIFRHRPDFELTTTHSGSLGVELAMSQKPDLILLDLDLPDFSGVEVLRRLKANIDTEEIPVIVVSADAQKHRSERLLAEGADSYICKPFDVKNFVETVSSFCLDQAS